MFVLWSAACSVYTSGRGITRIIPIFPVSLALSDQGQYVLPVASSCHWPPVTLLGAVGCPRPCRCRSSASWRERINHGDSPSVKQYTTVISHFLLLSIWIFIHFRFDWKSKKTATSIHRMKVEQQWWVVLFFQWQKGKGGYLVSCTTECLQLKCVFRI